MTKMKKIKNFIFSKEFWPVLLIGASILLIIATSIRYEHNFYEVTNIIIIALISFIAGMVCIRVYHQ
jgi:glucan phosphoethanolaminetransferase (alkaline phosphatase superfamily)